MVMENKATSSSSSPSPKPDQKHKSIVVAVEEKETMNNLKQGVLHEVASESTTFKTPSFRLGVVRTERDMKKKYPLYNDLPYKCKFCILRFSSSHALCGHQNSHRYEKELEKKRKMMESNHNSYQADPYSIFGGRSLDASSNDNQVRFSLASLNPIGGGSSNISLSFNNGVPIGITNMNTTMVPNVAPYRTLIRNTSYGSSSKDPLPSYNYNPFTLPNGNHLELSRGPFNSIGGGSSSNGEDTIGIADTNMTVVPPAASYRFFTNNISYSTSSRDHLPSYNYSPHALSDGSHLELSLGPFKSKGGSSIYPWLNGEVTELSTSVVPRVTPYHNFSGSTSYIPFWNPLPSYKYNMHDSTTKKVPPPTTNISNDLFSSEENLNSKGKKKVMVLEEDDKNTRVIADHDEDEPEEAEAKCWGQDLSVSL